MFSRSWSTPYISALDDHGREILIISNFHIPSKASAAPFVIIIILHKCVQNTSKFKRIHKITLRKYKQKYRIPKHKGNAAS